MPCKETTSYEGKLKFHHILVKIVDEYAKPHLEQEEEFLINSSFKKLQKKAENRYGKGDEARVLQAFELANEAHSGIRRKSGEPYILHPIAVARIVSEEIGLGTNSIIAALLHDTIEDTDLKLEDIEDRFIVKLPVLSMD